MEIPILRGIYTDSGLDIRVSYPVNYVPTVVDSGISASYLRPADGIVSFATGQGLGRGGINWNDIHYRVSGSKLVSITAAGLVTVLGDVGNSSRPARLDYSFDRLIICSNSNLFYYTGGILTQVTDADLGASIDACWLAGYTVSIDGEHIITTDLNDPTAVNPLKYGSSEADPDPINSIHRLRNELVAVNRHTIELFEVVGGSLFPLQRIEGAQIQKGSISTRAACIFADQIAFVGGGRNEAIGVYLGANATTQKISTQEIDELLASYTSLESSIHVEAKTDRDYQHLIIHLPDRAAVFDYAASQKAGAPIWFFLTSAVQGFAQYRARDAVFVYGKWITDDPTSTSIGELTTTTGAHYGDIVRWEFSTPVLYIDGAGAIVNQLELVSLNGRAAVGVDSAIGNSFSDDGYSWSQIKYISAGTTGQALKRLVWWGQGYFNNWRIERFNGDSQSRLSVIRLEAQLERMAY